MPNVLQIIEQGAEDAVQIGDSALQAAWRGFISFGADAVEVAPELAASEGVSAGAAAAGIDFGWLVILFLAPVVLIAVCIHVWFRDQVKGIPLVGGALVGVSDWIYNALAWLVGGPINQALAWFQDLFVGIAHLVQWLEQPQLQRRDATINWILAWLGSVQNLEEAVAAAVASLAAQTQAQVHQLEQQISSQGASIGNLLAAVTILEDQRAQLQQQVNQLRQQEQGDYAALRADLNNTSAQLNGLTHAVEIDLAQLHQQLVQEANRIDANTAHVQQLQQTIYQQPGGLITLLPLLGLATLPQLALDNLKKLGINPCECLDAGGGYDWLAPAVANLEMAGA